MRKIRPASTLAIIEPDNIPGLSIKAVDECPHHWEDACGKVYPAILDDDSASCMPGGDEAIVTKNLTLARSSLKLPVQVAGGGI